MSDDSEPAPSSKFSQTHSSISSLAQKTSTNIWNHPQQEYFLKKYPWLFLIDGKIGCSTCRNISLLGKHASRRVHTSKEWSCSKISATTDGSKVAAQKRLQKKIYKHVHSEAHCQAKSMLKKQNEKRLETSMASATSRLMTTTENCLRSAYFIAYNHRPMPDMQALVQMQTLNGSDLGLTLKSKDYCIAMVECISADMRKKLCRIIIYKKRNISIVTDESTSLSQNTCLILYIEAEVDEFDNKPENRFLHLCELKEQKAEAIFKCILETLQKYGFNHTYLSEHLVYFISDRASVMLGCKSEVGARLKKEFLPLVL